MDKQRMNKQKSKCIDEFAIGSIITRIECVYHKNTLNSNWFDIDSNSKSNQDNSYIGVPLKYLGCLNGKIYAAYTEEKNPIKKGQKTEMNYEAFKNGWAEYINPSTLTKPVKKLDAMEQIIKKYNSNSNLQKEN